MRKPQIQIVVHPFAPMANRAGRRLAAVTIAATAMVACGTVQRRVSALPMGGRIDLGVVSVES